MFYIEGIFIYTECHIFDYADFFLLSCRMSVVCPLFMSFQRDNWLIHVLIYVDLHIMFRAVICVL